MVCNLKCGFGFTFEFCVCIFLLSSLFFFFFFPSSILLHVFKRGQNSLFTYYLTLFTHCSNIVHEPTITLFKKKILKIGLTILFTHLKIILHAFKMGQNSLFTYYLTLFTHCSNIVHEPTVTLFKKNIKNRSHDTIHIFKNYFVIIFLVFNFQF